MRIFLFPLITAGARKFMYAAECKDRNYNVRAEIKDTFENIDSLSYFFIQA